MGGDGEPSSAAATVWLTPTQVFHSFGNERSREWVRTVPSGFGITRVKGAPRLAQEHAVGRVLHQGVLEQVARIKWDALPRQQTGF
jgi:hypothetical protein